MRIRTKSDLTCNEVSSNIRKSTEIIKYAMKEKNQLALLTHRGSALKFRNVQLSARTLSTNTTFLDSEHVSAMVIISSRFLSITEFWPVSGPVSRKELFRRTPEGSVGSFIIFQDKKT